MVNAQHFLLELQQVVSPLDAAAVNLVKMLREGGGHDDFADVMNQPGDIINFFIGSLDDVYDLAGHQGRADAMAPEFAPWETMVSREFLEIFNNRRHHRKLADLADTQIKNALLNIFGRFEKTEIAEINQSKNPRGKPGSRRKN